MDLSEITSYQPNVDLDQIGQPQLASGKRKRLDDDVGGDASVVNDERARALRLMAQDSEEASQGSFRTSDLKRLVLSFEKKVCSHFVELLVASGYGYDRTNGRVVRCYQLRRACLAL